MTEIRWNHFLPLILLSLFAVVFTLYVLVRFCKVYYQTYRRYDHRIIVMKHITVTPPSYNECVRTVEGTGEGNTQGKWALNDYKTGNSRGYIIRRKTRKNEKIKSPTRYIIRI